MGKQYNFDAKGFDITISLASVADCLVKTTHTKISFQTQLLPSYRQKNQWNRVTESRY